LQAASEAEALRARESQRAHLLLAAAHSPQALPPVSAMRDPMAASGERWSRQVRSRSILLAGALALASLGVVGGLYFRQVIDSVTSTLDFRRGTLFFAPGGMIGATSRLQWGLPGMTGRVVPVLQQPATMPPRLLSLSVQDSGERHDKVFLVRGRDTTQLTSGLSDDVPAGWSPDGRFATIERGWKADGRRYQRNIFLVDPAGRVVRRLTNSNYQDQSSAWSPTGTRIAFVRDSLTTWTVWDCDADGARCDDLSSRFRLPNTAFRLAFSPDGSLLAAASTQSAVLNVIDLDSSAAAVMRFPVDSLDGAPVWSPDGRWVAFLVHTGGVSEIRAIRSSGGGRSRLVARVPSDLHPTVWSGSPSWLLNEVRVAPRSVALRVGTGVRVAARLTTIEGMRVESPVRWTVNDSSIARVDDAGFVRGRSPGSTLLVANAGGVLADTISISVAAARVDTLLLEDWSRGLDTSRWTRFGSPSPLVVRGPGGRPVFWNHGDYNHTSGVASTASFTVGTDGLTVEAEGWVHFTGAHWQFWTLAMVVASPSIADERAGGDVPFRIMGNNPTQETPDWICTAAGHGGGWPGGFINRRWRRFTVVLRPDGKAECYVDGSLLSVTEIPARVLRQPLAVLLLGQSVGTRLYHRRVVVTRGLRY
jgi:hypothetical protein